MNTTLRKRGRQAASQPRLQKLVSATRRGKRRVFPTRVGWRRAKIRRI